MTSELIDELFWICGRVRKPIPRGLKPSRFLLRRWRGDPEGTPATPFQSLVYYTGISTGSQRDQTDLSTAPSSFRARLNPALGTFLLLIGLNLLNFIDRYILPGAQPLIQREFHATDQQMGALTTAMFVFYMFAARLTGALPPWPLCGPPPPDPSTCARPSSA